MIFYYISAVLLIYLSVRSFLGGFAFFKYVESQASRPASSFSPQASVIMPCRGVDEGFAENVAALLDQNYPDYEIIFVVDSAEDPAVAAIERAVLGRSVKTRLVIAGKAVESSQKVENLREALSSVAPASEVIAFVDSDARPSREWLRSLVLPLEDISVGAVTGYRWFITTRHGLASNLRSVWNASIASSLGGNRRTNFCWGGSMALRREQIDSLDVREQLRGTLSDDLTVTRIVKEASMDVCFAPQAIAVSLDTCTFGELIEFTNRQIKITRVYARHLWAASFFGSALFVVVSVFSFLIVATKQTAAARLFAVLTLAAVSALSTGKALLRLRAIMAARSDFADAIARQTLSQITLWPLAPAIFLVNCVAALLSRTITWRGIVYRMESPSQTTILNNRR